VAGFVAGVAALAFLIFLLTTALLVLGALGVAVAALLLSECICGATFTACSVVQPPMTVLHVANACPEKMARAVKIILKFNLSLHVI